MKISSIFLLVVLATIKCLAQTRIDPLEQASSILPPSPTASELGKYGLVPIGLSTGTPNINVPLYTFTSKTLSLPLSLSYSSSGISVDQIASWVGMAWSLNAGGVVTRTIRDIADEENMNYPYPTNPSIYDPEFLKYLEKAGEDTGFDSEADLYTFNFMGHSGKFVYERTGALVVMPHQNIQIQKILQNGTSYFEITTIDGIKYTFGDTETSKTNQQGGGCGRNYSSYRETSWYLTKIEHPAGDVINFEYKTNPGYSYYVSASQTLMKKTGETGCNGGPLDCPVFNDKLCATQLSVNGKVLTRIWATNHGEVEFMSTKNRLDINDYKLDEIRIKNASGFTIRTLVFSYEFPRSSGSSGIAVLSQPDQLKYRMFLTTITEKDLQLNKIRSHTFEYIDMGGLPPRFSFDQDHWGFFNGAGNSSLVPKSLDLVDDYGTKLFPLITADREPNGIYSPTGLLSKITYPTGGYTFLMFEANTYWGSFTEYPNLMQISKTVTGTGYDITGTNLFNLNNVYTQEIFLKTAVSQNPYVLGTPDPVHHFALLTVTDLTTGSDIISNRRINIGENYDTYITMIAGHTIRFKISANGNMVDAGYVFSYYPTLPLTKYDNVKTGGLRVSKVTDYDPQTDRDEVTSYIYAKATDTQLQSTGKIGNTPIYHESNVLRVPCGIPSSNADCRYTTLYSSSQNSITPFGGSHIAYTHVTVAKGTGFANGVEEHEFLWQMDQPGRIVWGSEITNAPLSNASWMNGLEKAVRIYSYKNNALVPVKTTVNNYALDNRNGRIVNNLVVRKKFENAGTMNVVVPCDASNTSKVYYEYTCITNHSHWWCICFGETKCIAPGQNNTIVEIGRHPCYGKIEGESAIYYPAIDNLDVLEYQSRSFWYYLESTTESLFDENGDNPVTVITEFTYDNPTHGLLTRTKTISSDNKIAEVRTWYPNDYATIEMNPLISNFIVGVPVKTEKTIAGNLTEGSVTVYTNAGQPKEIYAFNSPQLAGPTSHDPQVIVPSSGYEKIATLNYSNTNNLQEVVSNKAPTLAYIWGYNDSKPVAKVLNATAAKVAYTSFEEDGKGNWTYAGVPYQDIPVKTGKSYYNLASGNITINLTPGKYKLEYWAKGNVSVSGGNIATISISSADGNGWILYEQEVTATSTLMLALYGTSTSLIDELKLYPIDAQMTTCTYEQSVGISSITDVNNRITYYCYDAFGRLQKIKDDKGNILKTFEYHYKQ